MENTIFLASMWGPAMLAVGIGFFMSKRHYQKIYRDIQREPFALLIFGMAGIAAAIAQISMHNVWGNLTEVIISFLGWGLLLKSILFLVMPNFTDKIGNRVARANLVGMAGTVMIVIGGYLSWIAYLA